MEYNKGDLVDVMDGSGVWNEAEILEVYEDGIQISYIGWRNDYDEILYEEDGDLESRVAALGTFTRSFKCFVELPSSTTTRRGKAEILYWPVKVHLRSPGNESGAAVLEKETRIFMTPYGDTIPKRLFPVFNTDGGSWLEIELLRKSSGVDTDTARVLSSPRGVGVFQRAMDEFNNDSEVLQPYDPVRVFTKGAIVNEDNLVEDKPLGFNDDYTGHVIDNGEMVAGNLLVNSASFENHTSLVLNILVLILLRILVGFWPHSGEGDDHNGESAYGGDYEAQRHWMEVTYHLPVGIWYFYDLQYWGLDYPPLTAYASYIFGYLSHSLNPSSVALFESRGYETVNHKAFMRFTVLILDVAVYFSAVWVLTKRIVLSSTKECIVGSSRQSNMIGQDKILWLLTLALAQPAIILIDHGHFQYNTVSLGLALWSFHFMTLKSIHEYESFKNCVIGSILFCLALNFKQMTLYYAPVVFSYLLARCFEFQYKNSRNGFKRFIKLGITVILTFWVLWFPFYLYPSEGVSGLESLIQVLHRQFPFQRGLFEGKVANLWCSLNTKPLKIRERIPASLQPYCALLLTLFAVVPIGFAVFQSVTKHQRLLVTASNNIRRATITKEQDLKLLLWATGASALAFFLASFQVHEKQILIALSPLTLMFVYDKKFVACFSIMAAWSLYPLLQVDKLEIAYFCCLFLFLWVLNLEEIKLSTKSLKELCWKNIVLLAFISVAFLLHLIQDFFGISAPVSLPDLYPVLWGLVGSGFFTYSYFQAFYHVMKDEYDFNLHNKSD